MGFSYMVTPYDYEVLLATYNGAKYLEEQLDSIASQTIPPRRIIISDDCSSDNTIDLLRSWSLRSDIDVQFLFPDEIQLGSCFNFEKLLLASTASYVMLSDQDDIWATTKAEILFAMMDEQEKLSSAQVPLLGHSDLRIVNDQGQCIHPSFFRYQHLNAEKNDYLSIALQNLVSGCALLVNRACVVSALPFPNDIVLHDWWLALIASRLGSISVTMQPCLAYRQHSSNVVGAKGYYNLL